MCIYASFDNDAQVQIASNQGWSDFGNWVDALDADEYDQLIIVWEHGWSQEIETLAVEIERALQESPPHETVADVAGNLLAAIKENREAEAVFVNDGFTKDDGEE